MAFAKTPEGKIYYEVKGQGPVVVLIRGLGLWSIHWHEWDRELAKFYKVITFDNRGLGRTTIPMRPWTSLSQIASDIKTVLRTERLEAAHIVGTSFGGMTAIIFALENPQMTLSLTAIAASIGQTGHMRMSLAAARFLMSTPLRILQHKTIYEDLANLLTSPSSPDSLRRQFATEWEQLNTNKSQPALEVIAQLCAALRFRDHALLSKITVPCQIVVGQDDQFVPKGNSVYLHSKIPNSTYVEIPHAGHEPHVDQPALMTETIRKFISEI